MTISLPQNISIAQARLPATYENAKRALANCASIDECQDWADKAEALATYAKMADDDSLRQMADRIQARAVRRCGELLKQYDGSTRNRGGVGSDTTSQREMAERAGLSKRQQVTAVRVANVPGEQFEEWVEGPTPPTVTKLAEAGKRPGSPQWTPPEGFKQATALLGTVADFAEFCRRQEPEFVAGGVMPSEIKSIREKVSVIDGWLDRFVVNLGTQE